MLISNYNCTPRIYSPYFLSDFYFYLSYLVELSLDYSPGFYLYCVCIVSVLCLYCTCLIYFPNGLNEDGGFYKTQPLISRADIKNALDYFGGPDNVHLS